MYHWSTRIHTIYGDLITATIGVLYVVRVCIKHFLDAHFETKAV